jgi:hypothetical protein
MAVGAAADSDDSDEELPAWSLPRGASGAIALPNPLAERVDRAWALDG